VTHPPHKCFNCRLTIGPDEPEVAVDTAAVRTRKMAAGLPIRRSDYGPVRYRHATYEACSEAERRVAG
jgi:hypothetical protein